MNQSVVDGPEISSVIAYEQMGSKNDIRRCCWKLIWYAALANYFVISCIVQFIRSAKVCINNAKVSISKIIFYMMEA